MRWVYDALWRKYISCAGSGFVSGGIPGRCILAARDETENGMKRRNWMVTLAGVGVFFLGLLLMVFVGKNHHGVLGFLAPFSLIAGLVLCIAGMLLPADKSDSKG